MRVYPRTHEAQPACFSGPHGCHLQSRSELPADQRNLCLIVPKPARSCSGRRLHVPEEVVITTTVRPLPPPSLRLPEALFRA